MTRRIHRHRPFIRALTTWVALVSIASLLALPALALAEENLVVSSSTPADWNVIFDDPGLYHVMGSYADMETVDTEYGPQVQTLYKGEARVSVTLSGGDTMFTEFEFSSWEDFQSRSAEAYSGPADDGWSGAQRTKIGGYDAYLNVGKSSGTTDSGGQELDQAWVGWIPLGTNGVIIIADVSMRGNDAASGFDEAVGDVESLLGSLRFRELEGAEAGSGAPTVPGDDEGSSTWRTVVGGMGAVAAAAIALASVLASARAKSGADEPAPDQPVGYVLQLSTRSLRLSAEHSASFSAQAFAVTPDGSYRPASDVALVLHLPSGVSVQPQTAYGTLQTSVWQTAAVPPGSSITVEAQAPLGTTTASVALSSAEESRIVTRTQPADMPALRTQGDHSVTLIAAVELLGTDAQDPALDREAIRASIAFAESSEWLEISEAVDYEDGRAITVAASQPDPTSPVQPPESATIGVTAQIGERLLSEVVAIPLAGLPEIDAKPDEVWFAAESGAMTEVAVTISNSGDVPWQFETEWREGSPAIASAGIEATGPSSATLTLTEDGGENLDPARAQTASTLVVVATAEGFEELRRYVQVIVTQEGLFIDRTNVDPSTGAFPVAADGTARTTAIDVRVYVRDPASGDIAPDIGLAQQVTLEIGGDEGTSGHAGLKSGGLIVQPAGVRQLNVPSATFNVSLERKLPTDGEPVPATLLASVPGYDADRFSALVPLRLVGVNMAPYSDAWEIERQNCLDIIGEFVPPEYRDRLYALVNERGHTMGAEGLFYMRKQLWSFAYDQLMIEKHGHLDDAWWYEQVENTLEWVSWCGDIAMGVVSGTAVGVVGGMALGMLKPLLVSAMEVWLAGGSLEDWLMAQSAVLTGILEGGLTDPDFLTKLSGDKKAIGWALFIAYYFAKELYNDPQMSVTNAAKNVARQLRDEGLIRFLQMIAGMKGITPGKPKAGDAGTTKAPDAAATKAPDAGTTKAPDAAATRTPDAGTPDAPRTPDADGARPGADTAVPEVPVTRPKPDAGTPDAAAPKTPDADSARAKDSSAEIGRTTDADVGTKTPDGEAGKPADADAAPKKPADTDADAGAEKTPEKLAEKTPGADVDPRTVDPDPAVRAKNVADDIAAKTRDGQPLDVPTVERVMRDPDAMRELRAKDPQAWQKFNETRQKVYKAHDAELKAWAKKNLPEGQEFEIAVHTVGHVDGVDRDYRLGYFKKDPSGHHRFIEIPREKWAGESQRIFSEKTGGPSDPKGAEKWASERQQLQTDFTHEEASIDMADQGTVYDPKTGKWEETRFTPNDQMVKDGRSTLIDPNGYGKTYETKVMNSYKQGNTLDAYTQAGKAVDSLYGVRQGYIKQGYRVDNLSLEFRESMAVVKAAKEGLVSVSDANAELARLGYEGGLPDFMNDVSKWFGGLGSAQKW